ncbi:MAG: hypothetical protein ABW058_02990, partial [Methylobacterium sp.]
MAETASVPVKGGSMSGAASVLSQLALPTRGDLHALSKRSDLMFATGVMGILAVLIFPLPAVLLDLLLAV